MNIEKQIKKSLDKAIDQVGTQLRLEEKTGVKQPAINRLLSGKRSMGNMTVNTLMKLFPEIEITFFKDERQVINSDLSTIENNIMSKVQQLNENAQLDLISDLAIQLDKDRAASKHPQESVA